MTTKRLKILVQLDFPSKTVRLFDGAGPYMDADGNIWAGAGAITNLDALQSAINGTAQILALGASAVDPAFANLAFADLEAGQVIGSAVTIYVQPLDEYSQPNGPALVVYGGAIDDVIFDDSVSGDNPVSVVTIEIANKFNLIPLVDGGMLSQANQIARALVLNPTAPNDVFCDRMPTLVNKTLNWPDWN